MRRSDLATATAALGQRPVKTDKARRNKPKKLGTLALAKSVRKRVPPPSRPFKDKKAADRRSWRKEI